MKSNSYDVVVIGAGPAGSLCARNLAQSGYQVLLLEKRPVVGVPVRCGEATGSRERLSQFLKVNETWLETSIQGVIMHATGGQTIRYDAGKEVGVMVDRALFDQDLAASAAAEGAELVVNARVTGIGPDTGEYREVSIMLNDSVVQIRARMVVGADGAEALSGRMVGLKTQQLPPKTCSAIELRLKAQDPNPNHLTFWQGHDSINKGYVWIFPKVKSGVVNLGSGIITPKMGEKNMYDLSMEYKRKYFPDAELLNVHGGCVPVSGNLEESTADRFLLSGDAAHHTNPLTGGGIMASIVAAETAAKWIEMGLKSGNLSKAYLRHYEAECWDRFGHNHHRQGKIRDFVLGLPIASQTQFYRIFNDMVKGGLKGPSKIWGYTRLMGLAAKNWDLAKPVIQAGRMRPYAAGSGTTRT